MKQHLVAVEDTQKDVASSGDTDISAILSYHSKFLEMNINNANQSVMLFVAMVYMYSISNSKC